MTASSLRQVTIVGLGLIGGSIAKALRARDPDLILLAVDREDVGKRSDVQALISRFIDVNRVTESKTLVAKSDLVVLCQPVRIIAETVAQYLSPGCVVTDTGSTKRHIVDRARASTDDSWFVPGHPMAGKEVGGFENSGENLFTNRPWIVCPEGRHPSAVALVEAFVDAMGARRITMTPAQHDSAVALTSHAPQILASFLQIAGKGMNALDAAGPAFAHMTRIAGGSEGIWRDIFETNADEIGKTLRDAALALATFSDALLANPPRVERILQVLEQARASKRSDGAGED